ncbi:pilus assembly protein [Pusillimonas sp. SM2304]|uniref:TadE/TadG family type IV pilus assembly protein n=1 Tax=Pusillimonas sp. SM2304 TaxID=3073241 RepID=UPI00287469DA|nr:TadE/TadG family type IV pilus assembly protein [Pusillimonas sp. SM2304]MDS1140990.1 pilus assembly protein [Pusillimonas sp. SM2304]
MPPVLSTVRQRGASLIEFSIIAIPIMLMALGGIDVAQWLLTRQAASLALLEAGRAGATSHAKPQAIATAFEQALLPLFPASRGASAWQNQGAAFLQRRRDTGAAAWQIQILSPPPPAFNDFADPALSHARHDRLPTINNDYQFEQDQRRRNQGWPGGLGPASRVSIYQANTLVLRLTYLHEPVVPGMKGLMRLLGKENGSYGQHAMARGYLPISREISLSMQSHPVLWPMPEDGSLVRPGSAPSRSASPSATQPPCTGLWCRGMQSMARPTPPAAGSGAPGEPAWTPGKPLPGPVSYPEPMPSHPGNGLTVPADDPACGVAVCCEPA